VIIWENIGVKSTETGNWSERNAFAKFTSEIHGGIGNQGDVLFGVGRGGDLIMALYRESDIIFQVRRIQEFRKL
jgi:hypothetical protein